MYLCIRLRKYMNDGILVQFSSSSLFFLVTRGLRLVIKD
jgi:hypothetical protein